MDYFALYFHALQAANLAEITEHSLRPDLKNLLSAVANTVDSKITILHEGKREGKFGAPDFKVTRVDNIIGYVENKKIGENLDIILKSEQIKKYQQLSNNILITNYLEWIWLNKGDIQRETLCSVSDIARKKASLDPGKAKSVAALIQKFFSFAPEGIGKPKDLAQALALRGKMLKEFLAEELQRQEEHETKGKLFGLYQTFQKYVFTELTLADFADTFAQNLIYGLFLAKLTADAAAVTLQNAELFIPTNFELIRELVEFLKVLQRKEYTDIRWVIEEILTLLNTMNFRDIAAALSFTRTSSNPDDPYAAKDPYVYFYEDFLAAYDQKLRKSKGVYYTPPQVVNFIVRAVDEILQDAFHLPDGLADHERVTVLDFAAGTGTFLLEVMRQILQKFPNKSEQQLLIREHILKNLYGFEYLLAPYTIAHLKLSQFLKDNQYTLQDQERFQIFLTNTLEPTDRQINIPLLPALTEETRQAQVVKDKPILVILGNPPYSYESKNLGTWISEKIKAYYVIDGKKLAEKNPKGLQDDYVKFIRFAQDKMDQVHEGIVATITNHSFLDNPTFRGMRQSLMHTFNQLYFIDLHGNSRKKEKTPDGGKDENVFDIEQGVAISILVKKPGLERKIYHTDFWGTRDNKYKLCLEKDWTSLDKTEIQPESPFYLFLVRDDEIRSHYAKGVNLKDIFKINSVGIVTSRDKLTIHWTPEEIWDVINKFIQLSDERAREIFELGDDARDWKITFAKKDLQSSGLNKENIIKIDYRPFDTRFTYYTGKGRGFHSTPRGDVMQHLLKNNIALLTTRRGLPKLEYTWAFVSKNVISRGIFYVGNQTAEYCCPLYLYEQPEGLFGNNIEVIKTENFTKAFRQFLDQHYHKHYTPEEIVGYIYAVLHSPTYRSKYAEFLKIDFPRIPFTPDPIIFETLSTLGWRLIQAHVMHEIPACDLGQYHGEGNHEVIKPEYRKTQAYERLYINPTQYFAPVPETVYHFQIGGYQVLDKYLKDRRNRTLTLSEVKTVRNIVKILAFTLDQMRKIDDATRTWI